jgi:hypothetical protein
LAALYDVGLDNAQSAIVQLCAGFHRFVFSTFEEELDFSSGRGW